MNKYKTQNHPYLPDGIESRVTTMSDRCYGFSSGDIEIWVTPSHIKAHPQWFTTGVDYKEKLEQMGFECKKLSEEPRYAVYREQLTVYESSYEKIYKALNPGENCSVCKCLNKDWGNEPDYEETKADVFAKAEDDVTLSEVCLYLKKKGLLNITIAYEGYGNITNMENYSCWNFKNLRELKTLIRNENQD